MSDETLSLVMGVLQILTLFYIVARVFRQLSSEHRTAMSVYYFFSMVCFLVSDLYWMAFVLLKQGTRLPFTPSEIGDDGVLLLLGSALSAAVSGRRDKTTGITLCTVAFAAANAALWIGWSGEWVKDIVGGVAYGYLLCSCTRALKLTDALSRREWRLLGAACAALILMQSSIFVLPAPASKVLDGLCYVLLFAGEAYFLIASRRAIQHKRDTRCCMSLVFSGTTWALCAQYMSGGLYWYAADLLVTAWLMYMMFVLERQGETA